MSLVDELVNDPVQMGYAQHIPDNPDAIVSLLNDKRFPTVVHVEKNKVSIWAASFGVRSQIEDFCNDPTNSLRDAALAIRDFLQADDSNLDLTDPVVSGLVNAWPTSAEAKAALFALGTVPKSRAEIANLPSTLTDVLGAIFNDDGSRRI